MASLLFLLPLLSLGYLLLAGCASTAGEAKTTVVSWEEAVELVLSGDVVWVSQTHSLSVTVHLRDGRDFITREPRIDLIFDVIDDCGAPCAEILQITE